MSNPSKIKTVVELDMVGYSDIARELQENLDVSVVAILNEKIQEFVDVGLEAVNKTREKVVKATNGDNAVIVFENASDAHLFAKAVHEYTQNYNAQREGLSAKRWFRIGCATGELNEGGVQGVGIVIATAYRLEAEAKPGQLLIDTETYDALAAEQKKHYSDVEQVSGKRDEKFRVRRWEIVPRVLFLGLMAQENFQLRHAVDRYENDFQSIKEIISSLGNYKSLHDSFQELEELIGTLKSNEPARSLRIDNNVVKQLVSSGRRLKKIIDKISPILKLVELKQELGSQRVVNWKDQLDLSHSNIVKASENQTPDKLIKYLKRSIFNINSVIGSGLSLLNQKLFNKAQMINQHIKPAIDCLSDIQSILYDSRLFYQHELDSFTKDNIEEIEQILVALDREINIHNLCQEINDHLNVIDNELEDKTINEGVNESFVDQWGFLKKSLEQLYEPGINNQPEGTLEKIRKGVTDVSESIRDNGAVSAKFYDLKDDTYSYFVSIDTRLLETIAAIADKLKDRIENDPKDTSQSQVQNKYDKYIVFLSQRLGWHQ